MLQHTFHDRYMMAGLLQLKLYQVTVVHKQKLLQLMCYMNYSLT